MDDSNIFLGKHLSRIPEVLLDVEGSLAAIEKELDEDLKKHEAKLEEIKTLAMKKKREAEDLRREKEARLREARESLSKKQINNEILRNVVLEQEREISILESDGSAEKENEISEEKLRDLIDSVLVAEKTKKDETTALVKERDTLRSSMWYYKTYLNCHVEFEMPDVYLFRFSNNKNDAEAPFVKFRSPDFKNWEVLELSHPPENHEEISEYLRLSGDIRKFMKIYRQHCLKQQA